MLGKKALLIVELLGFNEPLLTSVNSANFYSQHHKLEHKQLI